MKNKDNKCILLVRVSTQHQDFDEQMKELFKLAIAEGYAEHNIIAIAHKESARKLNEEQRLGLTELKTMIENDSTIDCVYAWEISRIARTKKVLFSIEDFLIQRKIQLVIKEPSLHLLAENGSIDRGAEMIFTMYAQLAESEMDIKIQRVKRTMQSYVKEGRFTGGRYGAKFGYAVDEGNQIIINEEEAKIVRHIYQLYIENRTWGISQLRLHLREEGHDFTHAFLNAMLYDEAYKGQKWMRKAQQFRPYPPIITREMYDAVRASAKAKCAKGDKSKSYTFLSTKLIECPCCHHLYTTFTSSNAKYYRCVRKNLTYKHTDKYCANSKQVNALGIDSASWNATIEVMTELSIEDMQAKKNDADLKIKDLTATNKRLQQLIDKISKGINEGKKLVIDGIMTAEEYKVSIIEKKKEIDRFTSNIAINNAEIDRLQQITDIKQISAQDVIAEYKRIVSNDDKQRMSDEIHKAIKKIEIETDVQYIYKEHTYNKCTLIKVVTILNEVVEYVYFFSAVDNLQHLIRKGIKDKEVSMIGRDEIKDDIKVAVIKNFHTT